jgi:tetratricopeptide (TPR) repeat protein
MAMTQVGDLYIGRGEYLKAIDAFLQALKAFPNWPDAYYGLAHCYYFIQDWQKTIDWIEIARTRPEPSTPLFRNNWKLQIEWLIFYTNALFHVGRQDEAWAWTLRALELDPANHWHLANKNLFESFVASLADHETPQPEESAAMPSKEGLNLVEPDGSDAICLNDEGVAGPC